MPKCDYGCGQEAVHQFGNGKFCCETHYSKCPGFIKKHKIGKKPWNHSDNLTPEKRKILSDAQKGKKASKETKEKMRLAHTGEKNHMYGKTHTEEVKQFLKELRIGKKHTDEFKEQCRKRMKGKNILTIEKIKELYPTFYKVEEMRYNPEKPNSGEIQVHCKNSKCKNSKENGGWFTPKKDSFSWRRDDVERGNGACYLYCSEECKSECTIFNKSAETIMREDQEAAGLIKILPFTQSEYDLWRQTVMEREEWICEYCGETASHAHHSKPIKLEWIFTLDPDYGIACCKKCHYKYGHKIDTECSTGALAHKIC